MTPTSPIGCIPGFTSNTFYQHGLFRMPMKFPRGYSGGALPCFYLMAPGNPDYRSVHDEIDFEFIGGQTPREIIMHTNLISGGMDYLEQARGGCHLDVAPGRSFLERLWPVSPRVVANTKSQHWQDVVKVHG